MSDDDWYEPDENDVLDCLMSLEPQYVAQVKLRPDSKFIVTAGAGWELGDGHGGIVLRLDLLPSKWDGVVLLTRNKKERVDVS